MFVRVEGEISTEQSYFRLGVAVRWLRTEERSKAHPKATALSIGY